jgi:putative membrane protein
MEKATRHIKNKVVGLVAVLLLTLLSTRTASAHDGQPPAPHDLWSAWNWDPVILLSLILSAWGYAQGQRKLRRRAGLRRSALDWRAVSFAAGLITLFLALISPLDALSTALFSAHMLQHILLIVIASPLLALSVGVSPGSFLFVLPSPVTRKLGQWWQRSRWLKPAWRALTQPMVTWGLNVLVLWAWHVPRLYQAALQNETLHMLEHLSFVGVSLLFWWRILRSGEHLRRGDLGILALFTMALQGGLLGALITFAPTPWYEVYASTTQPWGLSPLADQQLAGGIMWIPAGTMYTLAALILFFIRLAGIERAANQREGREVPQDKAAVRFAKQIVPPASSAIGNHPCGTAGEPGRIKQ